MSKRQVLELHPLTAEAFSPYGDVIEVRDTNQIIPINYGLTQRHHNLANIDVNDAGGKAILNLFRSDPIQLPFQIKIMEHHPLGSQAFMPLSNNPYVVVVALAGDFHVSNLQAFLAQPHQGVNYHKGTWHHYCLSLNSRSDFLVVDREGAGNNCNEIEIDADLAIYLEDSINS